MSPGQIVRTVAVALVAGGLSLGLVPAGQCGAGWWDPVSARDGSFGWFAYEGMSGSLATTCETAMAPVGSWAIALIVAGATLLLGAWFHTSYRPKAQSEQPDQPEH